MCDSARWDIMKYSCILGIEGFTMALWVYNQVYILCVNKLTVKGVVNDNFHRLSQAHVADAVAAVCHVEQELLGTLQHKILSRPYHHARLALTGQEGEIEGVDAGILCLQCTFVFTVDATAAVGGAEGGIGSRWNSQGEVGFVTRARSVVHLSPAARQTHTFCHPLTATDQREIKSIQCIMGCQEYVASGWLPYVHACIIASHIEIVAFHPHLRTSDILVGPEWCIACHVTGRSHGQYIKWTNLQMLSMIKSNSVTPMPLRAPLRNSTVQ